MSLPARVEVLASCDSCSVVVGVEQLVHQARELLGRARGGSHSLAGVARPVKDHREPWKAPRHGARPGMRITAAASASTVSPSIAKISTISCSNSTVPVWESASKVTSVLCDHTVGLAARRIASKGDAASREPGGRACRRTLVPQSSKRWGTSKNSLLLCRREASECPVLGDLDEVLDRRDAWWRAAPTGHEKTPLQDRGTETRSASVARRPRCAPAGSPRARAMCWRPRDKRLVIVTSRVRKLARRLPIGHPDDVDGHDRISIMPGDGGDRLHQLARLEGSSEFGPAVEISLDQRDRDRASPGGTSPTR